MFHFGLVFVDDFIFGLDSVAAPLQTSTLLLCIAYLNIPLSWHKLELGYHITWIGWDIDTWSDTITLPQDKMHKILQNISELKTSGKFKRSLLESVTGNILWVSGIFSISAMVSRCFLYNSLSSRLPIGQVEQGADLASTGSSQ